MGIDEVVLNLLLSIGIFVVPFAMLYLYFLPVILARKWHHTQTLWIFFLNALLGWTLIGWVVALAWAGRQSQRGLIQ